MPFAVGRGPVTGPPADVGARNVPTRGRLTSDRGVEPEPVGDARGLGA